MDVNKILLELRGEREQIEDAIISLERLARGRGKRRGRPPSWMKMPPRGSGDARQGAAPNPSPFSRELLKPPDFTRVGAAARPARRSKVCRSCGLNREGSGYG